ncbi:Serine dehydrogenase proteinase [Duganella sp. CF517]|uniref:SDH family Clp fold serine proteinase n=1 Tax=Duganella sp. CF517 TaxID=1881038 RepID=UPI0008AAC450|nr:hypothetical protein [Duganella sp. CF517]SEO44067.1 Serine dehydrogenase proteinase [Duganella sp. CF517]
MRIFDTTIRNQLQDYSSALENLLGGDVMFYCGQIHPNYLIPFRHFIEAIVAQAGKKDTLNIFVRTGGGSAEMVEKMVEIVRHHYSSVHFIVPDFAMSAGTIWCMSGDKIYMDYSSSLGPIDPQVPVKGREDYVPAMGYLDQYEKLIEKSRQGTLSGAEYGIIQSQDQGVLARYEQARDLSVSLLKKWLVEYKFKDWAMHRTDAAKIGQPVTAEEKAERAEQIAKQLGNHKEWNSHGRMIGINTLKRALRLEIEDYSANAELRDAIRTYNDLLTDYMQRQNYEFVLHSKNVF